MRCPSPHAETRSPVFPPRRRSVSTGSAVVFALLFAVSTLAVAARAQSVKDDERDEVRLRNGRTVRGRVAARYDPEEVLLMQGGSRERIPRKQVASIVTVNDHMAAWLATRTPGLTVAREWELVSTATEAKLDAFARLQALHVLERDPDHADAHAFLGHRKRRDGTWSWPLDEDGDRMVPRSAWDEHHAESGHPLVLRTEHFELRSTGGLRRTLDLAFDLERLYLAWMHEFGERIRAREVFVPMVVQIAATPEGLPALSTEPRPYYRPERFLSETIGGVNAVYTFFPEPPEGTQQTAPRPVDVFEVVTQQLIYSTLFTEKGMSGAAATERRLGTWLEVGLGHWFGSRMQGAPGYAELGRFRIDPETVALASTPAPDGSLRMARSELTNLIGLRYGALFEVRDEVPLERAKIHAFVAFLMDDDTFIRDARGNTLGSGTEAVCRYLFEAWHEGKGHSSSRVDDALFGQRIERLDPAWRDWLARKSD
jgi:hypothetical protein